VESNSYKPGDRVRVQVHAGPPAPAEVVRVREDGKVVVVTDDKPERELVRSAAFIEPDNAA
jgi:hypothetical protein